jgi:hypothetical protein
LAVIVELIATAHGPFCYIPPSEWHAERIKRPISDVVPIDDLEANIAKGKRIENGFSRLRSRLADAQPDVLIVLGNDQRELFDFTNYPAISILGAPDYHGLFLSGATYAATDRITVKGEPDLATLLLTGLMQRGFDPAFSLDLPASGHGLPHAIMNPLKTLTNLSIPVVPILLNCYYTPQVSAMRSYQVGRAIREILDADPSSLRVAIVGSGGLWHTSGEEGAYIDEAFDTKLLDFMAAGDIESMARHFDSYQIPKGDRSQLASPRRSSDNLLSSGFESTGLPPARGPQGGTRETCCWIAAAAVADGKAATIIDYVPIYASPIGVAFAYWPSV